MSKQEPIHSSIDEFIWPNKWSLSLVGLWPIDSNAHPAVRYFSYFRAVLTFVLTTTVVLPQLAEILDKWGDLQVLTEVGCLALTMALAAFKQSYLVARRAEFERVYRLIRVLWRASETPEESRNLERYAWQAKFSTAMFYIVGCSSYVFYVAAPIYVWKVNERLANGSEYERHLLLGSRFWFDASPTPTFEITYAYQAIGLYSAGNSVVAIDGSMMMVIMHVIAQFKIIGIRLAVIGRALGDENFDSRDEIRRCVMHHERMLSTVDELNELLGPMILAQLMLSVLEICLNGYAIISGDSHGLDTIKYVCLLVASMMQLVIYCWPGEMLVQESLGLAGVVYCELPWFALSHEQQRDLCLIVVRSQRQSEITAMGLQVMSLQKITEVFNAAASFMALLRSMRDKQQQQ